MLIGDQTQSNLLRVVTQKVGDIEQGSVIPFFEGLESGVMRPVFLPDGSLLLGQTGRGWQAKGGKVASLQHVRWDGKTVAPGHRRHVRDGGWIQDRFHAAARRRRRRVDLRSAISLESWTYRDAPDYGSPELDLREESTSTITVSPDRKIAVPDARFAQTSRACIRARPRASITRSSPRRPCSTSPAPAQLDAYYTLRRFPASASASVSRAGRALTQRAAPTFPAPASTCAAGRARM